MKRVASLLPIVFATVANAQVVSYEADVFPETVGWERVGGGDAVRSVEDGFFVQFVDVPGALDAYQRSLADFADEQAFFIEWRVETDAPSVILDSSGTPVAVLAFGIAAANYHFTITDARVQVWRSNFLPILIVDIEPDVPHTYRLELCGQPRCAEDEYAWYIDNQLGDSGVAEGPYPNPDSMLIWGVRHQMFDATTRWDYIRFGTIEPDPIPTVSEWGVLVMALLFITTGAIVLVRRHVAKA